MIGYMSFRDFFGEVLKIVLDAQLEFSLEPYSVSMMSDKDYVASYRAFVVKLRRHCVELSTIWFFGPSKFISDYMAEVLATRELPRADMFPKLVEITESYLELCP